MLPQYFADYAHYFLTPGSSVKLSLVIGKLREDMLVILAHHNCMFCVK